MENVEKLRVLLQHWIDHNKGHAEEFSKWQEIVTAEGQPSIADHIARAIEQMLKVNEHLKQALTEAGGPKEGEHHHHHH